MQLFTIILFFISGLMVGSFLNVCVYRIPLKESIIKPPSKCPKCKKLIKPWDNIPLVSYLILGGKCRHCKEPISFQYPFIELITGMLFAFAFLKFGLSLSLLLGLFYISVLTVVTFIDIKHLIIPNKIMYPAFIFTVVFVLINFIYNQTLPLIGIKSPFLPIAGFLAGGIFLFIVTVVGEKVFKQEVMGGGDIKLAAFLGIFLGWYILLALFLGFLFGSTVGVILVLLKRKGRRDLIPFGPSLALGGIVTLFFGLKIYEFYVGLWMIQ